MRVLVVEDEMRLLMALAHILKKAGYVVDTADDGIQGQDMAETNIYDVIILDRMLPHKEGVEILQYLRKNNIFTPIIFLTAKDSIANRVEGLNAGADDYLIKPFSNDELLARVKSLSRRSGNIIKNNELTLGKLSLNIEKCEVSISNEVQKISVKETQLLELLIRNKGQSLSKGLILDRVWGFNSDVEIKNVDLYIYYIRKKIDFEKANLKLETIRGIGFQLKEVPYV